MFKIQPKLRYLFFINNNLYTNLLYYIYVLQLFNYNFYKKKKLRNTNNINIFNYRLFHLGYNQPLFEYSLQ